MSTLEILASKHGRVLAEVKVEIIAIKENFLQVKELLCKSLLREGRTQSMRRRMRRKDQCKGKSPMMRRKRNHGSRQKGVQLPIFEGVDPQGWLGQKSSLKCKMLQLKKDSKCHLLAWRTTRVTSSNFGNKISKILLGVSCLEL